MGLNFYHHVEEQEPRHIGKHSARWQFMFRGWKAPRIESWASWKFHLLKEGRILDDDGREYCAPEFINLVEKTAGEKNHCDHMAYDDGTFKDQDGWPFSLTEFC